LLAQTCKNIIEYYFEITISNLAHQKWHGCSFGFSYDGYSKYTRSSIIIGHGYNT